jgi:hypothetical protein
MEQNPSSEADCHSASKKFPIFYGTRRLITVFTAARQWSLSGARSIESTTFHLISRRLVVILHSYHLRLGLQSGLFPSGFQTKLLYEFLICPMRTTCPRPSHVPWLDHPYKNMVKRKVMKLLTMQSSPVSRRFLPARSKYSPQHPALSTLNIRNFQTALVVVPPS